MTPNVECPYCKETIKSGAYKCRFCNSWLIEGGQEAVDRLAWADERREACEALVAAGELEQAHQVLSQVVERAPEAPWANTELRAVHKRLVTMLHKQAKVAAEHDPVRAEGLCRRILELDPENDWAAVFVAKRDEAKRGEQDKELSAQARQAVAANDHEAAVAAARQAREAHVGGPWAEEVLASLGELPESKSIMLGVESIAAVGEKRWVLALSSGEIIEAAVNGGGLAFPGKAQAHEGSIAAMAWDGEALCTIGYGGRVRTWDPAGLVLAATVEAAGHPVDLAVVNGKVWVGLLDGRVMELREGGLVEVASVPRGLNALVAEGGGGLAGGDDGRLLQVPGLEEVRALPGAAVALAEGPVAVTASGEVHGRTAEGWWQWTGQAAPEALTAGGGMAVVAGRFGVRLLGPEEERELGGGAASGAAISGNHLLVARTEGELEVWNLSRWLG